MTFRFLGPIGVLLGMGGCAEPAPEPTDAPTASTSTPTGSTTSLTETTTTTTTPTSGDPLVTEVRARIETHGIEPLPAPPVVTDPMYTLGQYLAFDKVLSGNENVACLTCHHPTLGTTDGRSLSFGEGAAGLGPSRTGGQRIPRNAPGLLNIDLLQAMFWDSRVAADGAGGFLTPAGDQLTPEMEGTLTYGVVAAQALFPVASRLEMSGQPGDNEVADNPADDHPAIWASLMARLGAIPEYVTLFETAYPGESFGDMTFAHAANAIAAFEIRAFALRNSPWEAFVGGDDGALTTEELEGALLFFDNGCADCHSGSAFTDFGHHNTGLAQFGPGRGDGTENRDDFGYEGVSGLVGDRYAFRTPTLLNVELTGPYGHAGQFADLEAHIAHYDDAENKLLNYDITANVLDESLWDTQRENEASIISTLDAEVLDVQFGTDPDTEVAQIATFLRALTDPDAVDLSDTVPATVPSGLPVAD